MNISFPKDEMLEEFESGKIPRSLYWHELISFLYDTANKNDEITIIYDDVNKKYGDISSWHVEINDWYIQIDKWQQQVSKDKKQSKLSAAQAKYSKKKAEKSQKNAESSEINSAESANLSRRWAVEKEDVEVESGEYSAYHWAKKAEALIPEDSVLTVNEKTGHVVLTYSDVNALPDSYVPAWSNISNKPSSYPPDSHTHSWSEIKNPEGIAFPGVIWMFAGTEAQVPTGWQLCDGNGETGNGIQVPDLRNRFIICSGSDYDPGATGGGATATTSSNGAHSHSVTVNSGGSHSHSVTVDDTTLEISQMPVHRHDVLSSTRWDERAVGVGHPRYGHCGLGGPRSDQSTQTDMYRQTIDGKYLIGNVGNSASHNHSGSSGNAGSHSHSASTNSTGAHTHTVSTLPPYYALAYIIKL